MNPYSVAKYVSMKVYHRPYDFLEQAGAYIVPLDLPTHDPVTTLKRILPHGFQLVKEAFVDGEARLVLSRDDVEASAVISERNGNVTIHSLLIRYSFNLE